ncbi:MAG: zinc-ribbon domain-containing protein [Bacteroidales bacterium]|nr:zinc-ribbon domain-containing protein [Bacteroidales bacterium]
MKYCEKCGQANEDGARFCGKCGKPFGTEKNDCQPIRFRMG